MADLPTGTVTFLFTDLEGSTALWQQHPERMADVIARHDAMLTAIISSHGGVVFRTVGDAVHAAFPDPSAAVEAALGVQRALAAEPWPDGIVLRVRIGIHTGAVEVKGAVYAGHTLNRVARLSDAGHGGQILLSAATAELIRYAPPPDVALRDLGEHRFKGLLLPERVYAIDAPDLPADFPPLRTLDTPHTTLPVRRGTLLGRDRELEAAQVLLIREDVGLVTFTGAGGTGKTSLAIAAGHELGGQFPDGVWFVPLASIGDPRLVPSAVMAALGLREEGGRSPRDILHDFLAPKQLLLILDNFEQVVGAAPLVAELLQDAPGLTVLVTSRVALRLGAEYELPIAPLSVPGRDQVRDLARLSQYAAVQLFIERAQQIKPSFHVTDENAPSVAEICSRLDGLPLAIELAAAQIRVLTPQALLARLDKRLPLLTGGAHDLPKRQQTMEATIAWSYDLLTEEERVLYRRLAVFSGTFTLDAAEAVCGDEAVELLEGLTSLVDKSLVRQDDTDDVPRFSMLQTIREYGLARLKESGEAERFGRRHAAFFANLAETIEREAFARGPGQVATLLEADWDNLRGALDWSLGEPGDRRIALRLVASLGTYLFFSDHGPEGRIRTEALFARPGVQERDEAWAAALITLAGLEDVRGDFAQALPHLHESERILAGSDDRLRRYLLNHWLGVVAMNGGNTQQAERLFAQNRQIAFSLNCPWAAATALGFVAECVTAQGRLDDADATAVEAEASFRDLQDSWGMGRTETIRASVAWLRGDYETAHRQVADSIGLLRQATEGYGLARAVTLFGIILVDEARYDEAEAMLTESLLKWKALNNRGGVILSLAGVAAAAAGQGQAERARRLYPSQQFRGENQGLLVDSVLNIGLDHFRTCIRERLGGLPGDVPAVSLDAAIALALEV